MTVRWDKASLLFFICPRPVGLLSVAYRDNKNIFPLNLMGPIGKGYFSFGARGQSSRSSNVRAKSV
jgi:hypothetical protein